MRRLPIYFLIDVSESMIGEPIHQVQEGIKSIIQELRTDPYAVETVYVSIIAFAGQAKKITPMVELYNFYPPQIPIGGGTSLGNAMEFLMNDISKEVKKTTLEEKGDWKPIVFLFTDGNPTDKVDSAFGKWNSSFRKSTNLIAISLGENLDTSILGKITETVLLLKNTDASSFKSFFKWVTASIKTSSISVSNNNDELQLAPLQDDNFSKIDLSKSSPSVIDENFAVILGKCQTTKSPYLIKYQKRISSSEMGGMALNTMDYKLVGAYNVDQTYFELSDQSIEKNKTVNTQELVGFPTCPTCGNQHGFGLCMCGGIMCVGDENRSICPWCGVEAEFSFGGDHCNVNRTKG